MAVDALEYDEGDGRSANALEEILKEPDKLSELDLEAFAKELERQGFGKKSITLTDIRAELYHRSALQLISISVGFFYYQGLV